MRKINPREMGERLIRTVRQNSPNILTAVGITGMFSAIGLAVYATPEAMRRIEAKKEKEKHKKLTTMQTIDAAWMCYIPSGSTALLSAFCLICANRIQDRRSAALAAAASLARSSLVEYREKVLETIGEKKQTAILEAIDRDHLAKNPPPEALEPPVTDGIAQPVLCYDAMFGRYFYSDVETLKRAANKLNWQMNNFSEPYISLNEFYLEIGLDPVAVGEDLGWRSDRGLIELRFSSQLIGGCTPCLVMDHLNPPEYGYSLS